MGHIQDPLNLPFDLLVDISANTVRTESALAGGRHNSGCLMLTAHTEIFGIAILGIAALHGLLHCLFHALSHVFPHPMLVLFHPAKPAVLHYVFVVSAFDFGFHGRHIRRPHPHSLAESICPVHQEEPPAMG